MSLQTAHTLEQLNLALSVARAQQKRIALVPTMGNLHSGHYSLIELAGQHADVVVASIFVNPTQFGPNEDFQRYPRTLADDQAGLDAAGCDILFAPDVGTMYPAGFQAAGLPQICEVQVPALANILCGAFRPGHFTGVATVVAKLFNLVRPNLAVFGEKDFQQLAVIRSMVSGLNVPVDIIGAPTRRAENGLALSSRNQYLSDEERERAGIIYATLLEMRNKILTGMDVFSVEVAADQALRAVGLVPDYAVVRSSQSIDLFDKTSKGCVALIAARLGKTRLIDNLQFTC